MLCACEAENHSGTQPTLASLEVVGSEIHALGLALSTMGSMSLLETAKE